MAKIGSGPEQSGARQEAREVATGGQWTVVSWAGVGSSSGQAMTPETILGLQPAWLPAKGTQALDSPGLSGAISDVTRSSASCWLSLSGSAATGWGLSAPCQHQERVSL